MTGGPNVMFGTKCPSITSRWIQSAPAASTVATSSPSRAKSADRIEGAMVTGRAIAMSFRASPPARLAHSNGIGRARLACAAPVQKRPEVRRLRSMSCRIIGVRISCMARSSLPPGITIELARDMKLSWIIDSR